MYERRRNYFRHKLFILFLSITFAEDIFRSNKYVESYARGARREAYRSSCKIVVKITPSIIRQYTIQLSQLLYPFLSSSYLQTDILKKPHGGMRVRCTMYFKLYEYYYYVFLSSCMIHTLIP
jgi:hypothetical protein